MINTIINRCRQLTLYGVVNTESYVLPTVFFRLLSSIIYYFTRIMYFEWRWQSDWGIHSSILVTTKQEHVSLGGSFYSSCCCCYYYYYYYYYYCFFFCFFCLPLVTGLRSRFLGGKDSFLKCFKQPFFGIVYCQKFPIIARIIIIIIIVIKNDWPKKIKT